MKLKGSVEIETVGAKGFNPVSLGQIVPGNAMIKTGSDGFVIIILLRCNRVVKVRHDTQVLIGRPGITRSTKEKIGMEYGATELKNSHRHGGDLTVPSSTCVASVKG